MSIGQGDVRLFRLFVTSYAPLAVILAIQRLDNVWPPSDRPAFWILAGLGGLGLVDAFRLPRAALRKGHVRVHLTDLRDQGGQVAAYVATYLLPFIGVSLTRWQDVLAVVTYFLVMFVVFLRSDLALVNPALYLTGWRVLAGRRQGDRVLLLAPRTGSVESGDMHVVMFGSFLVYDSKVEP
jgi:hypothetical protein